MSSRGAGLLDVTLVGTNGGRGGGGGGRVTEQESFAGKLGAPCLRGGGGLARGCCPRAGAGGGAPPRLFIPANLGGREPNRRFTPPKEGRGDECVDPWSSLPWLSWPCRCSAAAGGWRAQSRSRKATPPTHQSSTPPPQYGT